MRLDAPASAASRLAERAVETIPANWRTPLARLGAVWFVLLLAFLRDWAAMAHQWWDSSTYNHILLIPAILAWLVASRWNELRRLEPAIWWPGAVLFGLSAFAWVLGSFAGFGLLRQLAVVAMLQSSVLALLGVRVAAGCAFPLFYLFFLVPFGDEIIPSLQMVTARITMALLHVTGVPASIEGVFVTTPRGYFEVAEACSGVKFLIAMVAYGTLVANLCFRSWPRRAALLATCIVVPILANGVRAWGTIFIAQYRGVAFAQGFDHIFYGWVFFAIVMAVVMGMSWRFFDRPLDAPAIDPHVISASPCLARATRAVVSPLAVIAALGLLLAAALAWSSLAQRLSASVPAQVFLPEVPGWHRVDYDPAYPWQPLHGGSDHRLVGRYEDNTGHVVDVSYALYSHQGEGAEAGSFGQGAVPLGSKWAWVSSAPPLAGGSAERIQAPTGVERTAITWYRSGPILTGSNLRLKLTNIADRLLLRERTTATLIVSAEQLPGTSSEGSLAAFLSSTGDPGAWMDRIAGKG
ncbi:MAG: exosortase A [Sphingomonadales bacterium]|nr:exosortase A [Sphingomonadales bacterium]MDE2570067.1 exosortase A [Sphingomonadales bacterium]